MFVVVTKDPQQIVNLDKTSAIIRSGSNLYVRYNEDNLDKLASYSTKNDAVEALRKIYTALDKNKNIVAI